MVLCRDVFGAVCLRAHRCMESEASGVIQVMFSVSYRYIRSPAIQKAWRSSSTNTLIPRDPSHSVLSHSSRQ